jgi:ABC-type Fe3+ transport system substrate-binding protein
VQLVQVFSAAIVKGSPRVKEAKDLIEFLSSPQTAPFIVHYGMDVVKRQ